MILHIGQNLHLNAFIDSSFGLYEDGKSVTGVAKDCHKIFDRVRTCGNFRHPIAGAVDKGIPFASRTPNWPCVVVPSPRSRSYRIVLRYTTHCTLQSVVSS